MYIFGKYKHVHIVNSFLLDVRLRLAANHSALHADGFVEL